MAAAPCPLLAMNLLQESFVEAQKEVGAALDLVNSELYSEEAASALFAAA